MRVFLTGGTGLIGRGIARTLIARGDTPVILSRTADKARMSPALKGAEIVQGDPGMPGPWESAVDGCDAVINLAGYNLFAKRWNPEVKAAIRDSRVVGTHHLVAAIARSASRPKTLVQASAIGYYGPTGDEDLTESSPPGKDFMAEVCVEWENAASPAEALGLRVPKVRTGIVLDRNEGALGFMTPIFKYLPGGAAPVGSSAWYKLAKGPQWMSWIHRADIVGLFVEALDNPKATGPINGTSPKPVRNKEFSKELTRAINKTVIVPRLFVPFGPPNWMLKLALGEVADVVAMGQKVLPKQAEALGYRYQFPLLFGALADIFGAKTAPVKTPQAVAAGAGR